MKKSLFLAAVLACAGLFAQSLTVSTPADFKGPLKCEAGEEGSLKFTGKGWTKSIKQIPIDNTKRYTFSFEYKKLNDAGKPFSICIALASHRATGHGVGGFSVYAVPNSTVTLAAPLKKGDTSFKINEPNIWMDAIRKNHAHMGAFNPKDDLSDLPNNTLTPMIKNDISLDGTVTFRNNRKYEGKEMPAGTKLRLHDDICSFGIANTYANCKTTWQTYTTTIEPMPADKCIYKLLPKNCWWPSVVKVGFFVRLVLEDGQTVLIRNLKLEPAK